MAKGRKRAKICLALSLCASPFAMESAQAQVSPAPFVQIPLNYLPVPYNITVISYSNFSYSANPELFNTPENGGVMPWWTDASSDNANETRIQVGGQLGSFRQTGFAGSLEGPVYAYSLQFPFTNTISVIAGSGIPTAPSYSDKALFDSDRDLYYAYARLMIRPSGDNTINKTSYLDKFISASLNGGTLKVDQNNQAFSQDFALFPRDKFLQLAPSKIDTNGNFFEFSGSSTQGIWFLTALRTERS